MLMPMIPLWVPIMFGLLPQLLMEVMLPSPIGQGCIREDAHQISDDPILPPLGHEGVVPRVVADHEEAHIGGGGDQGEGEGEPVVGIHGHEHQPDRDCVEPERIAELP